jgi:hypothetical protein
MRLLQSVVVPGGGGRLLIDDGAARDDVATADRKKASHARLGRREKREGFDLRGPLACEHYNI